MPAPAVKTQWCTRDRRLQEMLFTDTVEELTKNNLLRCGYINTFQQILKAQFPKIGGLQCCPIGGTLEFSKVEGDLLMQIIHDYNHWVLVVKGFFKPDHIVVYDSMAPLVWKRPHTLSCMSSLLQTSEKRMPYIVKSCQQQNNSFDCEVFAIAFATSIAHGEDPNTRVYDRRSLRTHLDLCMKQGRFTPFPSKRGRPTRCKNSTQNDEEAVQMEPVYCFCRRTGHRLPSDEWAMIKCDLCGEWYHKMCHPEYPIDTDGLFHCGHCTSK